MISLAAVILTGVVCAQGGEAPLLESVPPDVHFMWWWKENPEHAFLKPFEEAVWESARSAGVGEGLVELLGEFCGQEAKAGLLSGLGMVEAMVEGFDHENLLKEGVVVARFSGSEPLLGALLQPEDVDRAMRQLDELLKRVARAVGTGVQVRQEKEATVLAFGGVRIYVGKTGPRLTIAMGEPALRWLSADHAGRRPVPGVWGNQRWRAAASHLPAAEDGAYFVDIMGAMPFLEGALRHAIAQIGEPEAESIIGDLWEALGLGRTFSCVAGVSWTDGRVLRSADVWAMAKGWRATPAGQALAAAKPEAVPFDRIPGEATSFSFQAGVAAKPIVQAALSVLAKHAGRRTVADVREAIAKELGGIDIVEVLTIFSGTQLQYTVRNLKPGLFGTMDQSVASIRVRDPSRCAAILKILETKLGTFLRQELGGMVSLAPLGDLEGFTSLQIAGMPMGSIAWGVRGDSFYFASEADVLRQSLAGENAGVKPFLWREELGRLGVLPQGPVYAFSYMDLGRTITAMAQVVGMAGMGAAFIPPDTPDAAKLRKVLAFIPRLAAPIRSLAFYGGMASVTGFDIDRGLMITFEAVEVPVRSPRSPAPEAKKPRKEAF